MMTSDISKLRRNCLTITPQISPKGSSCFNPPFSLIDQYDETMVANDAFSVKVTALYIVKQTVSLTTDVPPFLFTFFSFFHIYTPCQNK